SKSPYAASRPAVTKWQTDDIRNHVRKRILRDRGAAGNRLMAAGPNSSGPRFDYAEFAGAVADLGVLVPIAVALIIKNGLSPTAVLLPAALLYITAGLLYRIPVPVQPLKA